MSFSTPITVDSDTLTGPLRRPVQMLAEQEYGGHASVHDDETASSLGLPGAPIEGPTHFSQIDPLAVDVWGRRWFEDGCLSAHFQTMVVEGEEVRASLTRTDATSSRIDCVKADGTPVLTGTATVGRTATTELGERRGRLADDPGDLYIVDQLHVGMTTPPVEAAIDLDSANGLLYPFTLAQKLGKITEPCSWYLADGDSPWGRPILPTEMLSVLVHKEGSGFPVRGPSVGLFIDLEVRYVAGPVFVDVPYRVDHRIVAIGQSRRVESYWTESRVVDADTGRHAATVLLHQGVFKDSYAGYPST
jgi:hypothetical protein